LELKLRLAQIKIAHFFREVVINNIEISARKIVQRRLMLASLGLFSRHAVIRSMAISPSRQPSAPVADLST
jgi:hypothetical protein